MIYAHQINDRVTSMGQGPGRCRFYNYKIKQGAHSTEILDYIRAIRQASQGTIRITANMGYILSHTDKVSGDTRYHYYYASTNSSIPGLRRYTLQTEDDLLQYRWELEKSKYQEHFRNNHEDSS